MRGTATASASGKPDKAQQLRLEAFEAAPVVAGTLNGTEFEWVADADSRIGPFLEAIINGRYYWVPFHQISEIRCDEPEDLRDFVWAPAQFFLPNGGQTVGFIPTRYTGSETADDDLIRLARKTEWDELAEGVYAGLGQRMLVTDRDEYPLLEVRNLALANADSDG
jgi:type VI secretion system protein ImpE